MTAPDFLQFISLNASPEAFAKIPQVQAMLAEKDEELARLLGLIQWAHDTLWELNPSNYNHDEVCKVNDAAVEVILGLAPTLGYSHGYPPEWWADRAALKTDVTTYQAMVMDLTAEGEALRAKLAEVTAERSSLSAMFATQAEETQAAKARVAELEALIRGKTFTVDESVELKAENERLRTPQGAAKVLLTISDVEIKPAAKALQDAFNLKGIGWKRYLSALRAAITALQETKP